MCADACGSANDAVTSIGICYMQLHGELDVVMGRCHSCAAAGKARGLERAAAAALLCMAPKPRACVGACLHAAVG